MARQRSPNRDKAFELYEKHNGDITNRSIADQLGISEKTVGGWKSKDSWLKKINGVLQSNERSTPFNSSNKGGAPPGNQNAKGNKGGSAPKRNKNAVVTGQYETFYTELLKDNERDLLVGRVDSSLVLEENLRMLRYRHLKMFERLKQAENGLNDNEKTILYELRGRKTLIETKGKKVSIDSDDKLVQTEKKEVIAPKIDTVLRIEKALNEISAQLARTTKQFDDSQLFENKKEMMSQQIEKIKAEIEILRGSKEGNADATDWKSALAEAEKELQEMGEPVGD